MKKLSWVTAVALGITACGPAHVAQYTPKKREYQYQASANKEESRATPGSLWQPGTAAAMLFTDARALRENDLVVVKVEEVADAARNADTDLSRESKVSADVTAFLQAAGVRRPDISVGATGSTLSSFRGDGSTRRTERLTATVPALVRKVLPNGNLFVEGHRVVLVNAEEHHFYISGVVRPIDIDQQNSVKSSMIADAEVEFTGQGNLTDNQRQGWFSRFFTWLWPF